LTKDYEFTKFWVLKENADIYKGAGHKELSAEWSSEGLRYVFEHSWEGLIVMIAHASDHSNFSHSKRKTILRSLLHILDSISSE